MAPLSYRFFRGHYEFFHVGGGVRTPVDGIVTQTHNRWDRSAPGIVVGLTYVFGHHTMTIFIRDEKRDDDGDVDFFLVTMYPSDIIVVGVS